MLEGGGFESDGLSERRKGEAVQNKPPLGFKQEVASACIKTGLRLLFTDKLGAKTHTDPAV